MRFTLVVVMCIWPAFVSAQTEKEGPELRGRFLFAVAAGGGVLDMKGGGVETGRRAAPSFPNLKFGYSLSERMTVVLLLPGTIYKYRGMDKEDRSRGRGFEGILPSVQYWVGDRTWLIGGAGLTLDAPLFYDVRQPSEGNYYVGPSVSVGAGYEMWRRGRYSADVQSRLHYGAEQAEPVLPRSCTPCALPAFTPRPGPGESASQTALKSIALQTKPPVAQAGLLEHRIADSASRAAILNSLGGESLS